MRNFIEVSLEFYQFSNEIFIKNSFYKKYKNIRTYNNAYFKKILYRYI